MNKLTIPAILVATVMVAGIFAFMPVEQASTVHDTIQANTVQLVRVTEISANFPADIDDGLDMEVASDNPFCLVALTVETDMDAADALGFSAIQLDDIEITDLNGVTIADATVNDADQNDENVTVDWIDNADALATGVHAFCANLEIDFIIDEGGTLVNTEINRITAFVLTTGDATVTTAIKTAD